MLGISKRTHFDLKHFDDDDGNNNNSHHTATSFTSTSTALHSQVRCLVPRVAHIINGENVSNSSRFLSAGQTETFGMNTRSDGPPLTVWSIFWNRIQSSNQLARGHNVQFDINWHAFSSVMAREVPVHSKLRTNLRLDL